MVEKKEYKGIEEVIELIEIMSKQTKLIEQQSNLIDQLIAQQGSTVEGYSGEWEVLDKQAQNKSNRRILERLNKGRKKQEEKAQR